MLKKITSKISIVILIFVIIAGSFLAIIYLPVYNQSKINNLNLKDVIFLDDKSVDNTQLKPQIDKNKEYKIVPLNDNWKRPLNPIFSIVSDEFQFNDENKSKGIRITVYELKRSNIFDQNFVLPQLPKYNVTKDLSFTDTANLASRYDLTTSFPGKENYKITNYEPLTTQEIENNRKLRETNNKSDIIFKKYADIYFAAEKQGNAAKKKAILEEIIPGLQNILNQLNEGKTVPGTGGDIIPDQESKDLIQTSINEFEKEVKNL